uniref:GTP-binding protein n=1 Tax=Setaria digitata TaxID=48799 RepID=A0A915PJF9_9BILA
MAHSSKLTVVFIGSPQKEALLEKMKSTAVRSERHIIYHDTYYLTYVVDGSEAVVELIDPGLEHTGARQMSILKAHGVILFYQTSSQTSINQLCDVAHDFQIIESKIKPPIILIGNEDVKEKRLESTSVSRSEGYKSISLHSLVTEDAPHLGKRVNLNHSCHDVRITKIEGKHIVNLFGTRCKFLPITIPNYDGALKLMEEMIRTIRSQQAQRRSLLQKFRKRKDNEKMKNSFNSKMCSIT